jgi:hypothetical protein
MTILLLSVLPSPSLEHGGISQENDCLLLGEELTSHDWSQCPLFRGKVDMMPTCDNSTNGRKRTLMAPSSVLVFADTMPCL